MISRIEIGLLCGFLGFGAIVVALTVTEQRWPGLATAGYHAFISYVALMGAVFAACRMPVRNRPLAIFCILGVASAFGLLALDVVPAPPPPPPGVNDWVHPRGYTPTLMDSMNRAFFVSLWICLLIAFAGFGAGWGLWRLLSGAVALWNKPPPRLNGWQRIGVVVSVAWALGAWVHAKSADNWAAVELRMCLKAAGLGDSTHCSEQHDRNFPVAYAEQSLDAVIIALVPVPLGWLLVYAAIGVARWVRRGFRPASAQP